MEAMLLALQIYAITFIIAFFLAVMIKILLFSIRYFSRDTSKKTQDAR